MIRVTIDINGRIIHQTHAVRQKGDTNPDSINEYRMDFGDDFEHRYGDGAIECAIKMLKLFKRIELRKKTHNG